MDRSPSTRLVGAVLRCYPAHWRQRHGDEAAELAALLIGDGTPAASIALSYLAGAAREWLAPRPDRRLSTAACALLVTACSLGVSAALLGSTVPARAASTSQTSGRAHCRPGPSEPGPGVIGTVGRQQMIIWEAAHDQPC